MSPRSFPEYSAALLVELTRLAVRYHRPTLAYLISLAAQQAAAEAGKTINLSTFRLDA